MDTEFDPAAFDDRYKLSIVSAYSDIAQLSRDDLWRSTLDEREAAFARCLANKHLRLMHLKHLERERRVESLAEARANPGSFFNDPEAAPRLPDYVGAVGVFPPSHNLTTNNEGEHHRG